MVGFLGEKMYWESTVLDIAFQRKVPLGSEGSWSKLLQAQGKLYLGLVPVSASHSEDRPLASLCVK